MGGVIKPSIRILQFRPVKSVSECSLLSCSGSGIFALQPRRATFEDSVKSTILYRMKHVVRYIVLTTQINTPNPLGSRGFFVVLMLSLLRGFDRPDVSRVVFTRIINNVDVEC